MAPPENSLQQQRIQKWLSEVGICSRRRAEELIDAGKIIVNGLPAHHGQQVTPDDRIEVEGHPVHLRSAPPRVYWMLHKPDKTLCSHATATPKMMRIFDLPALRELPFRVNSVGRLDYRSEGLLLISNDGEFIEQLTHPRFGIEKRYTVLVRGKLSSAQLATLRHPVQLEDGPVQCRVVPGQGVKIGTDRGCWYSVTLTVGRHRIVRRLFAHFGCDVVRLIRYGIGPLSLDPQLKPGQYRQLSKTELRQLRAATAPRPSQSQSHSQPL